MGACRDCGQEHPTGLDGLVCDWTLYGESYVRQVLRSVAPDVRERTIVEVRAAVGGQP